MTQHTSSNYDKELNAISNQVLKMGQLLQYKLSALVPLLKKPDTHYITTINHNDHAINNLEIQIDDACQTIIAKRQPTASDLRFILAVGRMVVDLERIGDEYKKIIFMIQHLNKKHPNHLPNLQKSHQLLSLTVAMLDKAITAFIRLDTQVQYELKHSDKVIDECYYHEHKNLILEMTQDPSLIESYVEIMMINKSIERIGDHTKNIAEHIVYLVNGQNVRHSI